MTVMEPGSTARSIPVVDERRGRAMGTGFHVLTHGGPLHVAQRARHRLHELEAAWSRFLVDSEISRINAQPDRFHLVSVDTLELVERGIDAWRLTDGVFDPTILSSLISRGYDRTWSDCGHGEPLEAPIASQGCGSIEVDHDLRMIRLGAGVGFDPGGIGKGLAAGLLAAEAIEMGATGAMVNIGGDVVCLGDAPGGNGWCIEIAEPSVTPERIGTVVVRSGAVVTSTTRKRRWATGEGERHHVIDPATGESTSGVSLVSVVAAAGWYAEAIATQLIVTADPNVVDTECAAALLIDDNGIRTTVGRMGEYLR